MNDLKEFEKFLKICRKHGVTETNYDGCSVKLGNLPQKASRKSKSDDSDEIPTDEIPFEDLAFHAVRNIGVR